jgi:hypothetical protein
MRSSAQCSVAVELRALSDAREGRREHVLMSEIRTGGQLAGRMADDDDAKSEAMDGARGDARQKQQCRQNDRDEQSYFPAGSQS